MALHWTEQRDALHEWLVSNPRILIGCDFDGTLAPLVSHADKACLTAATKAVLLRLASLPGVILAVISGRSLVDLRQRVGLPGVLYAGNHGLEMTGSDGATIRAPAAAEAGP
ncbi:MAG: trehalose-phosphatase, partial [Prosthecobacter sp.]|nr:trehalose-phosphatase [Prosthecobacter sp.]